jgi:replicative superfamily II helicase
MAQQSIFEELSEEIVKSEKFVHTYSELLKLQHIGTRKQVSLGVEDIKFLLETAAILSLSTEVSKRKAYRIATILSENFSEEYNNINQAVQYILINTGQIPVIKKNIEDGNEDYFSLYNDKIPIYNPIAFRDLIKRIGKNRTGLKQDGKGLILTDFQADLFTDLEKGESVSISAPTSAGKSFLLKSFLAKRFSEKDDYNVVYLVPTRALIAQTQIDINKGLKSFGLNSVTVSSSSSYFNIEKKRRLFVLTQERFHNLLFDSDFKEPLDLLIIDEAQKISDSGRGILLVEVIEEAIKRNSDKMSKLQIVFLSPLLRNPEKFAQVFNLTNLKTEKTRLAPVAQNLIKFDITESTYSMKVSSIDFEKELEIGNGIISEDERNLYDIKDDMWKLLWAVGFLHEGYSIIYCNSPNMCIKLATTFCKNREEKTSDEINEIIAYLKETIHEKYYLIDCLKYGVGYHYGDMPHQIRTIVENLFREKKIEYLFCTSTLLEGVNLPAKSIFISKPTQGYRINMTQLNFWNLAGRAGRLLRDYYGNIICINVNEWEGYKPNPNDVEQDIQSILDSMIINKNKEIMIYLKETLKQLKGEDKPIEQAITKFIITTMKSGETEFLENLKKRNPEFEVDKLKAIYEEIGRISKDIQLPVDIIQRNSSIDPRLQQKLLEKFRGMSKIPVPLYPYSGGFSVNLFEIFKIIYRDMMDQTNDSYMYHYKLAVEWMDNKTISELIKAKLKGGGSILTQQMINKKIDELFDDIDHQLRYEYQKYLKCYIDILLFYYDEAGFDKKSICEHLPSYLEYGTKIKNIIILQNVGLSRAAAISLWKQYKDMGDFADEEDCKNWLNKNKGRIQEKVSKYVWIEINEVL